MRTLLLSALLLAPVLSAPAVASENWFDEAIHELEDTMGAERVRIPMWGLIRLVGGVATRPVGAKDWDVAIFENVRTSRLDRPFAWTGLGPGWKPMIRVHAPGRESVAIYIKPEGNWYRVLMATISRHDAVVMKFAMQPDRLASWVNGVHRWTD